MHSVSEFSELITYNIISPKNIHATSAFRQWVFRLPYRLPYSLCVVSVRFMRRNSTQTYGQFMSYVSAHEASNILWATYKHKLQYSDCIRTVIEFHIFYELVRRMCLVSIKSSMQSMRLCMCFRHALLWCKWHSHNQSDKWINRLPRNVYVIW